MKITVGHTVIIQSGRWINKIQINEKALQHLVSRLLTVLNGSHITLLIANSLICILIPPAKHVQYLHFTKWENVHLAGLSYQISTFDKNGTTGVVGKMKPFQHVHVMSLQNKWLYINTKTCFN